MLATSRSRPRARRSPLLIWYEPFRFGSVIGRNALKRSAARHTFARAYARSPLMSPFQPTVVLHKRVIEK